MLDIKTIREKQFATKLSGYDKAEVENFLNNIIDAIHERDVYIEKLEADLEDTKKNTESISQALVYAQATKHAAEVEANDLIKKAELESEQIKTAKQAQTAVECNKLLADAKQNAETIINTANEKRSQLLAKTQAELDNLETEYTARVEQYNTFIKTSTEVTEGVLASLRQSGAKVKPEQTTTAKPEQKAPVVKATKIDDNEAKRLELANKSSQELAELTQRALGKISL